MTKLTHNENITFIAAKCEIITAVFSSVKQRPTAASAQNENIICIAFIPTIIASHVEESNMKRSYNSWVAGFFRLSAEYIHDLSVRW